MGFCRDWNFELPVAELPVGINSVDLPPLSEISNSTERSTNILNIIKKW
jgi:hypothetical protein